MVEVDREPGRREVWYRLTPVGEDLRPVVDALGWWGLKHAWRWPLDGEPLHAEHLIRAAAQAIDVTAGAHEVAVWHLLIDGADYVIEGDGNHWWHAASAPERTADVTITASTNSLKRLILGRSDLDIVIEGEGHRVRRFRELISTLADVVPVLETS